MKLDDVEVPATPACRAALEVATAYCSRALLNHSVRAYLWAAGYGLERGIAFDAELLYVSAMLHDLALVKEFDNHALPFEEAGGHVAWVFGAAAGWPVERRRRAAEVIVRHMWDEVDVAKDPRVTSSNSRPPWTSRGGAPRIFPRAFVLTCLPGIHDSALARNSSGISKTRRSASLGAWRRNSSTAASPRGSRLTPWTAKPGVGNRKSGPNHPLRRICGPRGFRIQRRSSRPGERLPSAMFCGPPLHSEDEPS